MSLVARPLRADYSPGRDVLHGVDLTVAPASLAAVLGPSGSGKTTLLRALAGLHPVREGTIEIDGDDVTSLAAEARGIGFVPQNSSLFPHLTVAANMGYGIRGLRARRAVGDPRVTALLDLLGLADLAERMPQELSGGQQQRVAVARALAREPRLVLLDEPFSALDAGLRQSVRDDVASALHAQGVAAVLITHDQQEALSLADHLVVLRDGRVAQSGAPADVYENPADAWTARFLGEASIVDVVADGTSAHSALGPVTLTTPHRGTARAVLRPEHIEIVAAPLGARGTVERVRYFGHDALAEVALAELTVAVRLAPGALPRRGEAVGVRVTSPLAVIASEAECQSPSVGGDE